MRTLRLGLCVNNRDECGIALIQQFNSATKDKIQKQYLLQVEENRNPYTLRSAICMNFALSSECKMYIVGDIQYTKHCC